jgi:sugar/nucleoside kinase (ribokinase family)
VPHDLIAVGDVMLDGALPAPVAGGRVHGRIELRAGGSAANAALAAARRGARAAVIGRVGADAPGRLVADTLATAGVEPMLAVDEDAPTGCVIVVGDTSIVADPGASARLALTDLPKRLEARAVLVSGYSLLQPGPEAAARAALERATADWLAVDAASARLVAAFGADRFLDATATANVLLANADEARTLTGLDAEQAALMLARQYRVVCIKLGRDGAIAAADGDIVRADVRPLDRADTLGAGDAFAGGFLFALAGGAEPAVALRTACDTATATLLGSKTDTATTAGALTSTTPESKQEN